MDMIRVLVSGACGRMGRAVVQAVYDAPDMRVVGGVDPLEPGGDLGEMCLGRHSGLTIDGELPAGEQAESGIRAKLAALGQPGLEPVLGRNLRALLDGRSGGVSSRSLEQGRRASLLETSGSAPRAGCPRQE